MGALAACACWAPSNAWADDAVIELPALPPKVNAPAPDLHRAPAPAVERRSPQIDVAVATGYGFGRVRHPQYHDRQINGMTLNIDLALALSDRFSISLFASFLEMPVTHVGRGHYERPGGLDAAKRSRKKSYTKEISFRTGDATNKNDDFGGLPVAPALHNLVGGSRLEFSPRGASGPFMGMALGVGRVDLSASRFGGAVDVRSGYRQFLGRALALSVSIGVQGLMGPNTQTLLPYGSAELRFRFQSDPEDFRSWRSERGRH